MPTRHTASNRPGRRIATMVLLPVLVGLATGLGACNDSKRHGSYTSEGLALAQERLAQMKSGTEWQMSQQQYLAGDLDKALKTVDRSIALNPGVAKSHVLRGRILIEKGMLEKAKESLEQAVVLQPENVEAQYYLGIVHERFRMDEKALANYEKAAELDSGNPQYLICRAEMLVNLGRIDDAERLLIEKKESFGYNAAVRQTLGHICVLRGQHQQAAEYFNDALLLAPEDPALMEDLARSQVACGNFGDAEFNIGRLLQIDDHKDRTDLQVLRAKCLLSIDRPVEARTLLTKVVNSPEGGSDAQAWIDLGNAAAVLKDKGNLRLAGARATALAPDRFEGYLFRAMYLKVDDKPSEALAAVEQAIARSGSNTGPFIFLATLQKDTGKFAEAQATLDAALQRNPADPISRRLLIDMQAVTSVPTDSLND